MINLTFPKLSNDLLTLNQGHFSTPDANLLILIRIARLAYHPPAYANEVDLDIPFAEYLKKNLDGITDVTSLITEKGGAGSGNFGHEGRPGKVGGSASGTGKVSAGINSNLDRDLRNAIKAEYPERAFFATEQPKIEGGRWDKFIYHSQLRPLGYWAEHLYDGQKDFLYSKDTRFLYLDKPLSPETIGKLELIPMGKSQGKLLLDYYRLKFDLSPDYPVIVGERDEEGSYRGYMIHSNPGEEREKYPFRSTHFDSNGFTGHSLYKTEIEAASEALHNYHDLIAPDTFDDLVLEFKEKTEKGGPGSGNFSHSGRPGKVGGSAPQSGEISPKFETPTPESLGAPQYSQDNPKDGTYGVDHPKSLTAYFKNLWIDPMNLLKIPGERGEHNHIDRERVNELRASMEAEGFRPNSSPLICVEQDGHATFWEGNHRVRAAALARLKAIPIDIRYFGGGELADGPLTPEKVRAMAYNQPREGIGLKGGKGSGNFGHEGRPGKVGGSSSIDSSVNPGKYSKPNIESINDIRGIKDSVYIRWSKSVDLDNKRGYSLRGGTQAETGISVCEIDKTWDDWRILRQIHEYEFVGGNPWIVTGNKVGIGGDNEPLLGKLELIGKVSDSLLKLNWKAMKREVDIVDHQERLSRITDPIGKRIMQDALNELLASRDGSVSEKGGPGSGNFGHRGRPGKVGGSASESGHIAPGQTKPKARNIVSDEFREMAEKTAWDIRLDDKGQVDKNMVAFISPEGTLIGFDAGTHDGIASQIIRGTRWDEKTQGRMARMGNAVEKTVSDFGFVRVYPNIENNQFDFELPDKITQKQARRLRWLCRGASAFGAKTIITNEPNVVYGDPIYGLYDILKETGALTAAHKGGEGSGNFSHSGRPGHVGGSGSGQPGLALGIDTPAFRQWFGDSKVVDEQGKPLVVYHGTTNKFTTFRSPENEFYFTGSRRASEDYGYITMPVYLSMENPYIVDFKGGPDKAMFDAVDFAKENGYDGVIAKNTNDGANIHDQYVIFDKKKIKSVNNSGTFYPFSSDILKEFAEKGGPGSGNFGHEGRPGKVGGSRSATGGLLMGSLSPAAEETSTNPDYSKYPEDVKSRLEAVGYREAPSYAAAGHEEGDTWIGPTTFVMFPDGSVIYGENGTNYKKPRHTTLYAAYVLAHQDQFEEERFWNEQAQDWSNQTVVLGAYQIIDDGIDESEPMEKIVMEKIGTLSMEIDLPTPPHTTSTILQIKSSESFTKFGELTRPKIMAVIKKVRKLHEQSKLPDSDYIRLAIPASFPLIHITMLYQISHIRSLNASGTWFEPEFKEVSEKGGAGSGNFSHEGRPGKVGGSASATGGILMGSITQTAEESSNAPDTSNPPLTDELRLKAVDYREAPSYAAARLKKGDTSVGPETFVMFPDGSVIYGGNHGDLAYQNPRHTTLYAAYILAHPEGFDKMRAFPNLPYDKDTILDVARQVIDSGDKELETIEEAVMMKKHAMSIEVNPMGQLRDEAGKKVTRLQIKSLEGFTPREQLSSGIIKSLIGQIKRLYLADKLPESTHISLDMQVYFPMIPTPMITQIDRVMKMDDYMWDVTFKGGKGSGNFAHAGRPGKVGGSGSGQPGLAPGTDPEPWQMTLAQWMKHRPLPPQQEIPQKGSFWWLGTDDGGIYVGNENDKSHVMLAERLGIPPERIRAGGYIDDGELNRGLATTANVRAYMEQHRAIAKVAHRNAVWDAIKKGKPVPPEVLADYPFLVEKTQKGGPGSGNFSHSGRPGKVGGSSPNSPSLSPGSYSPRTFSDGIPPILAPLARLATRYSTFRDFEKAYSLNIFHGLYYHLTRDPNFTFDPKQIPMDASSMVMGQHGDPGFMVTSDLESWDATLNPDRNEGPKTRTHVAIVELTGIPKKDYSDTSRGFGHEIWVNNPNSVKILRVVKLASAKQFSRKYQDAIPQSPEELENLWKVANKLPLS